MSRPVVFGKKRALGGCAGRVHVGLDIDVFNASLANLRKRTAELGSEPLLSALGRQIV